jgi:DNA invertase Pin-like site-specific DNA recombinase
MLIGYARIFTPDQALDLQLDALKQAACERWFTDIASGAKADRPGLADAMNFVREGDVLVVWKLDRLGRSLSHLIETIALLNERGVGFKSLSESLDTTTSGGRLIFNIFGAIAERGLIQEQTHAGLKAARASGSFGMNIAIFCRICDDRSIVDF